MILREKYLSKIRPFYESDLVKAITGIRRCGKSAILNQIMDEVSKMTDNVIYLNFEKTSDFLKASDALGLVNYVNTNRKDGKEYYIQVTYSVVDDKAYKREFGAFSGIDSFSCKIVITADETDFSTSGVRHISLKDFLKMESL